MNEHLLSRRGRGRPARLDLELGPDSYVTDGTGLFRCISVDRLAPAEPTVLLEDCTTLEVMLWTMSELSRADVRLVR